VLSANADFQVRSYFAPALDSDAHQRAHAGLVNGDERVAGENTARGVDAEACRVVTADAERRLCEIVGAKGRIPRSARSST
jgi:hypothetical protein